MNWRMGLAAYYCGDSTAKYQGRLTLNPLAHLDPVGSIMLPLMLTLSGSSFLFGWAKPVPVNSQNLNDPLNDMVKVAIAGPLSNISLAVLFSQIIKFRHFFAKFINSNALVPKGSSIWGSYKYCVGSV